MKASTLITQLCECLISNTIIGQDKETIIRARAALINAIKAANSDCDVCTEDINFDSVEFKAAILLVFDDCPKNNYIDILPKTD